MSADTLCTNCGLHPAAELLKLSICVECAGLLAGKVGIMESQVEDLVAKFEAAAGAVEKGLARAVLGDVDGAHKALLAADTIMGLALESYHSATDRVAK